MLFLIRSIITEAGHFGANFIIFGPMTSNKIA